MYKIIILELNSSLEAWEIEKNYFEKLKITLNYFWIELLKLLFTFTLNYFEKKIITYKILEFAK